MLLRTPAFHSNLLTLEDPLAIHRLARPCRPIKHLEGFGSKGRVRWTSRIGFLLGILFLLGLPRSGWAQFPNPTSFSASPTSIVQPASITYCAGGGANMTVDLRYTYNGAPIEADNALILDSSGCAVVNYSGVTNTGTYTFNSIRNSLNAPNNVWTTFTTSVVINAALPTINSYTANASTVIHGQCTLLNWTTSGAATANVNGSNVALSGSLQVCPSSTTTYTLTAFNSTGQSVSQNLTLTVPPYDDAVFVTQNVPPTLTAGSSYSVSVTMQNSGTTTWNYLSFHLNSQNLANNTTWGLSQVNLPTGQTVAPGASWTFAFTITVPLARGTYNFQWQMYDNNTGFFGSPSVNMTNTPTPQPTSMTFSPNAISAGNGSYTLTVGNGQNMQIDFQYIWSGNPGVVNTVTHWTPILNASGQAVVAVSHMNNLGTYSYINVKNSLVTQWVALSPAVTLTILPPQPFANSLSVTPASFTPPSTFTMTAGNAGGITADTRLTINGAAWPDQLGWPPFTTMADGVTGQAVLTAATCTQPGNYNFTALRNTNLPNKTEASWVAENGVTSVACPGAPTISSVSPGTLVAGTSTTMTILGSNLCGTALSSDPGITFSNVIPVGDYSGSSLTATVTVDFNALSGGHPLSVSTACGSVTRLGAFTVQTHNAQFISQVGPPPTMVTGQNYAVSVTMKNTGSSTWVQAPYPTFSWYLASPGGFIWRPTSVSLNPAESIAPNQSKTFSFQITAPSTPGTYNFQWRMKTEPPTNYFGDFSPVLAVAVGSGTLTDNAQYVSRSVPAVMNPGAPYPVSVTFQNTGTTTWTAAGGYQLGSQNPQDNTTWGFGLSRVALATGDSIAPGASKTFTFTVTAPGTAGTYNFQWQMLQGTAGWFGAKSTNAAIAVGVVPSTQAPSKEYIYVGGRLIATEESVNAAGKRASQTQSPKK